MLRRGSVGERDLEKLAAFCPCALACHDVEREALLDVLLARKGDPKEPDRLRRQTFLLLLDLAAQRGGSASTELDLAFKAACLTESLDSAVPWKIPHGWEQTRRAWAVYERGDELSVAVLGIFWAVLALLDLQDGKAQSSSAAGGLVEALARDSLGKAARLKVHQAVAAAGSTLPPLSDWQAPRHEFQRAMEVLGAARQQDLSKCLAASADVLLALAARHTAPQPYLDVAIPPDYLSHYPLNLLSFQQRLESEWKDLSVAEWLADIATTWGIEAHLRVALRKMHGESIDTFLVYPTDEGIKRREDSDPPRPGFTASRVDRAVRFLVDLGLATWDLGRASDDSDEGSDATPAGWVARITPRGREILEALRG